MRGIKPGRRAAVGENVGETGVLRHTQLTVNAAAISRRRVTAARACTPASSTQRRLASTAPQADPVDSERHIAWTRETFAAMEPHLGDLTGARTQYERGLQISEAALGPDHPDIASGANNLGSVLQALGDEVRATSRSTYGTRRGGPHLPPRRTELRSFPVPVRIDAEQVAHARQATLPGRPNAADWHVHHPRQRCVVRHLD